MSGVITTGNHPAALWPGVRRFWGRTYAEHPMEWKEIFEEATSDKAYEEDVELTGFGYAPIKSQGGAVSYDSETQGVTKRYTHVVYGLGYIVTEEEREDGKYAEVSKKRVKALAFSMRQTQEVVGANVLNRAFNSSYTGGDGKELLATDHPTVNGTQSNELATPADLSEASLEDLAIQIMDMKNSVGMRIGYMPRKLIVATQNAFNAQRLLKSAQQSGTANNDINVIRGMFPDGVTINHYLTDPDAYFIKTDVPNGLMRFNRRAVAFANDSDFDTSNAKAKSTMRFSTGWTDWRGLFGSAGA